MASQDKRKSSNFFQSDCTSLEDSLFFRERNNHDIQQKNAKVNYLANDIWDLLLQNKMSRKLTGQQKGLWIKKEGKKIKSIIITTYAFKTWDAEFFQQIFSILINIRKDINIVVITNPFRSKNETFKLTPEKSKQFETQVLNILNKRANFRYIKRQQLKNLKQSIGNRLIITIDDQSQNIRNGEIHGKILLVQYETALRVCISTGNFGSSQWTVGGNGYWMRDFKKAGPNHWFTAKGVDFRNNLQEIFEKLLKTSYQYLLRKLQFNLANFIYDKLSNITLVWVPRREIIDRIPQQQNHYGLFKIRSQIQAINKNIENENKYTQKQISIISPFVSFSGQEMMKNIVMHTFTAFHGIDNKECRISKQTLLYNNYKLKPMRIFELTTDELYKACKYELRQKCDGRQNLHENKTGNFDLIQAITSVRRDELKRFNAFKYMEKHPQIVQVYPLESQQSQKQKKIYSNFTVHHTKLIACTYPQNVGLSDILFIGSPNFSHSSLGQIYQKNVYYTNFQVGVLIKCKQGQRLKDYIPIKFDTERSQQIQLNQIFHLSLNQEDRTAIKNAGRLQKRTLMFKQQLEQDRVCQQFKRIMKERADRTLPQVYQLILDVPITFQGKCLPSVNKHSEDFYEDTLVNGRPNLHGEEDDPLMWIADIILKKKKQNNIIILWHFKLNIFSKLPQSIKNRLEQKHDKPEIKFFDINASKIQKVSDHRIKAMIEKQFRKINSYLQKLQRLQQEQQP